MTTSQDSDPAAVAKALIDLADSLVEDYDVIELLHRLTSECVALLPIDAAVLLLPDQQGALRVASSSTEPSLMLDLFDSHPDEGPCVDCFEASEQVVASDLARARTRWPGFAANAVRAGFHAVHVLPLRLRGHTVGVLSLFGKAPGALPTRDLRIGQALADVATISILQQRALRRSEVLAEQLQSALHSRVVIEQAKGVIAERERLDLQEAFRWIRRYARSHNVRLTDVACGIVEGVIDL